METKPNNTHFKKVSFVVENQTYYENRFFDSSFIRDNQNACFVSLKQRLADHGVDLSTEDINPIASSDLVIFSGLSNTGLDVVKNPNKYLILTEPPILCPNNWDKKYHSGYNRIFTWQKPWVDNEKYFFLRFGYQFGISKEIVDFQEKKLCTMIVGYKTVNRPQELYSERLAAVNWFARNHPNDFELFGAGWPKVDQHWFWRYMPQDLCQKIRPFSKVYKGRVSSKADTLDKFKFSICYENMKDTADYVTEKIFDCFSAGCVPIYWGAANIHELIPSDCFIDRRDFDSYESLYKFIVSMDSRSYSQYIDSIRDYLGSQQAQLFSAETFAEIMADYILTDLGISKRVIVEEEEEN